MYKGDNNHIKCNGEQRTDWKGKQRRERPLSVKGQSLKAARKPHALEWEVEDFNQ